MAVPVTITITGTIPDNSRVVHLRTELALHDLLPEVLEGVGKAGVEDATHTLHIGEVQPVKEPRRPRAPKSQQAAE